MKFFSFKQLPVGLLIIVAAIGVLLLISLPRSSTAQTTTGADPKPDLTFAVIYRQANLISDLPGVAFVEDPLLKDRWGIALPSFGPFVVANDASGFATAYRGDIRGVSRDPSQASVFIEPSPGMTGATQPAAVVNNPTSDFQMTVANSPPTPARFIFFTLNGNINGRSSSFGSSAPVARSLPGHAYTGVAIGSNASGNLLYAADFLNGTINVFDKDFNLTTVTGGFADVSVPPSYHPFNVQ